MFTIFTIVTSTIIILLAMVVLVDELHEELQQPLRWPHEEEARVDVLGGPQPRGEELLGREEVVRHRLGRTRDVTWLAMVVQYIADVYFNVEVTNTSCCKLSCIS